MKLRLSYSLLQAFKSGNMERVINTYLRIPVEISPQMQRGIDFDLATRMYIRDYKRLPPELGGRKLISPVSDQKDLKFVVEYSEDINLSFELDTYDNPTIYEFKCSSAKDSSTWSNTGQLDFYFLGTELVGMPVKKAELFRFDPITKRFDSSLIWKVPRRLNRAEEQIKKYGYQIKEFLEGEGLL